MLLVKGPLGWYTYAEFLSPVQLATEMRPESCQNSFRPYSHMSSGSSHAGNLISAHRERQEIWEGGCSVGLVIFPPGLPTALFTPHRWAQPPLWAPVGLLAFWVLPYFKEIKPVNTKGNQSWIFIGRTDAEAEAPILWPPDAKSQLIGKDPGGRKDWRQEEKETTEDAMVGWCHRLNGHEFEQTSGDGKGQGSLVCCSPWGRKESDRTELLNNNNLLRQDWN